jgi:son of sevenless-like protein
VNKFISRFCAPNSPTNILIDYHTNDKSSSSFTIRGATIEKLIEHLTHHQLLHPRFVKSFLMTYKSYCTPLQLLNLLIERYNIPEPASSYLHTEQQLKKFRKEYVQPVKLRFEIVLLSYLT